MIFSNEQVDLNQLPKAEQVEYQRLEPNQLYASLISIVILFSILGSIAYWVSHIPNSDIPEQFPYIAAGILPTLFLLFSFLSWKGFQVEGYAVREKDILHKKGVVFKRETAIPFKRVQHCEIKQGPIQRALKLSTLEIFTAGGGSSDLSIAGLHPDTAQRLKTFLLQQTRLDDDIREEE